MAYQGKVGSSDFRIVLERTGDKLEGIATHGTGDDVPVRGEMTDATHFKLAEVVAKGKKGSSYEGKVDGLRIVGTWKDVKDAKEKDPIAFTAGPLAAFDAKEDRSFEETYLGSLGEKIRIRMKLKRDKEKLTGAYRYTRSEADLRLEGTVGDAGKFELVEKSGKGTTTGRFEGVLLERGLAFARWAYAA